MSLDDKVTQHLNDALEAFSRLEVRWEERDEVPASDLVEVHTLLAAAVDSFAPPLSAYRKRADAVAVDEDLTWQAKQLAGVVRALRTAHWGGYLRAFRDLVEAELFDDFLEMAEHLLEKGYKDPAAVVAGGVLEESLRRACESRGIATALDDRPKSASRMNDELGAAGAYSRLDLKSVSAWLDLRNLAAHGRYDDYSAEQVKLLIHGIRHFSARASGKII